MRKLLSLLFVIVLASCSKKDHELPPVEVPTAIVKFVLTNPNIERQSVSVSNIVIPSAPPLALVNNAKCDEPYYIAVRVFLGSHTVQFYVNGIKESRSIVIEESSNCIYYQLQ